MINNLNSLQLLFPNNFPKELIKIVKDYILIPYNEFHKSIDIYSCSYTLEGYRTLEGFLHGNCKRWFTIRQDPFVQINFINIDENYKYGLLHGNRKKYNRSETLVSDKNYKNGLLHGNCKWWDVYIGMVVADINYKDGLLHGNRKQWCPYTFELVSDKNYKDGLLHGDCKEWNDGILIIDEIYCDGMQK